jgi:hypothetical protein
MARTLALAALVVALAFAGAAALSTPNPTTQESTR